MGGSYAKALKRFGFHISAITKDQSSIDYALNEKIIDKGSTELDEKIIRDADLVIFALYPHVFIEWIEQNQNLLKCGAIITDVTGVKVSIVYKIQEMLMQTNGKNTSIAGMIQMMEVRDEGYSVNLRNLLQKSVKSFDPAAFIEPRINRCRPVALQENCCYGNNHTGNQ